MKKFILIAFFACSMSSMAQPVILNGNNFPAVGFTVPAYSATSTIGAGNAGENQTWNFTTLSFTMVGNVKVVDASATPFTSNFPNSNRCFTLTIGTNVSYYYWNDSTTKLDAFTEGISAPGIGKDYSPNPVQLLKFPFNFNDSITDTYQQIANNSDVESLIYDGYGTLLLPFKTYNNVVRIKSVRTPGNVYYWYNLNPLFPVLVYRESNKSYAGFNNVVSGVDESNKEAVSMQIYPNPAKDKLIIQVDNYPLYSNLKLKVLNLVGQVLTQVAINSEVTTLDVENDYHGLYFYQLLNGSTMIKSGKVIVE